MRCGINPHGNLVWVLAGDSFVHIEQVAVFGANIIFAVTFDHRTEVQVHAVLERTDPFTLIHHRFRISRGHIAGNQIAERGVLPFEVVVPITVTYLVGWARVIECGWHPDSSVITQRFRHQCQLGLEFVARRNTRRMDLGVARVGKECASAMCAPGGRDVGSHGVRRQVVDVAVATGRQHDCVTRMAAHFTADQVSGDHSTRSTVFEHHVQQFSSGVEFYVSCSDLLS